MKYFDHTPDRTGTWSIKWDYSREWAGAEDLVPLWVADMDFPAPEPIIEALRSRIEHGIFGYTKTDRAVGDAIASWIEKRHGWTIDPEGLLFFPGVVPAIVSVLEALTKPGEGIIIQPPVYYPFREVIETGGRRLVENPLVRQGDVWTLDLDDLRVKAPEARALLLSSPHNPVGRVWSEDEIQEMAEIAHDHDLLVISDEIHWDLILPGYRHVPFASVSPENRVVTLTSPSKTFNLAGLSFAYGLCSHEGDRQDLASYIEGRHGGLMNVMGLTAAKAAYDHGGPWLDELVRYVNDNAAFVISRLGNALPALRFAPLEGTYLLWINVAGLGLTGEQAEKKLKVDGGVWVHGGHRFGTGGGDFIRINLASSRDTLTEAVERIIRILPEKPL